MRRVCRAMRVPVMRDEADELISTGRYLGDLEESTQEVVEARAKAHYASYSAEK